MPVITVWERDQVIQRLQAMSPTEMLPPTRVRTWPSLWVVEEAEPETHLGREHRFARPAQGLLQKEKRAWGRHTDYSAQARQFHHSMEFRIRETRNV